MEIGPVISEIRVPQSLRLLISDHFWPIGSPFTGLLEYKHASAQRDIQIDEISKLVGIRPVVSEIMRSASLSQLISVCFWPMGSPFMDQWAYKHAIHKWTSRSFKYTCVCGNWPSSFWDMRADGHERTHKRTHGRTSPSFPSEQPGTINTWDDPSSNAKVHIKLCLFYLWPTTIVQNCRSAKVL